MRPHRVATAGWLHLLTLTACPSAWVDEPPQEVCEQVGFAVASRTFACTGDEVLAIERQDAFHRGFRCVVEGPPAPVGDLYHCPAAILDLRCDEVEALGDDLDSWLDSSPACPFVAVGR